MVRLLGVSDPDHAVNENSVGKNFVRTLRALTDGVKKRVAKMLTSQIQMRSVRPRVSAVQARNTATDTRGGSTQRRLC